MRVVHDLRSEHGSEDRAGKDVARPVLVEVEARDARNDMTGAAERAKNEAAEGVDRAEDEADNLGDKVSDAVEDMIPGDSDRDGH